MKIGETKTIFENGKHITKCQVANCENESEFVNPRSDLKYCEYHAEKLHFKIVYQFADSKNGQKEDSEKLIPIPTMDFDMMKIGSD